MALYSDKVMDHFVNPRNVGEIENADGVGTVGIVVTGADMAPAAPEVVQRVQAYIDPNGNGDGSGSAPIGAVCTVSSAVEKSISLQITADILAGFTVQQAAQQIRAAVEKYFSDTALVETRVSVNKLIALIIATPAVDDISAMTVSGSGAQSAYIDLAADEVPRLQGVRLNGGDY